jgi:hypothetical protein
MSLGNFYPNASQLEKYICCLILTAHRDDTRYLIYTGISQPRLSAVNQLSQCCQSAKKSKIVPGNEIIHHFNQAFAFICLR